MALEMRTACEQCGVAIAPSDDAYICTFECTYCAACVQMLDAVCSNCGGELVRRPRPASVRARPRDVG